MAITWQRGPIAVSFGSQRGIIGRILTDPSLTEDDIPTGLKRVDYCAIAGMDTTDQNIQITRNSNSTTDNDATSPGNVHVKSIQNGASFNFIAIGQ